MATGRPHARQRRRVAIQSRRPWRTWSVLSPRWRRLTRLRRHLRRLGLLGAPRAPPGAHLARQLARSLAQRAGDGADYELAHARQLALAQHELVRSPQALTRRKR